MRALTIRQGVSPDEARRLLAIAAALDGLSRETAARIAGMDPQMLRDWAIRYNRGGPAGLSDHWGNGRPCRLTEGQQAALKAIVLRGPDPDVDGLYLCHPGAARCAVPLLRALALEFPDDVAGRRSGCKLKPHIHLVPRQQG